MSVQSMTGFARTDGQLEMHNSSWSWGWEIKSVNAKGFDCRCRLPKGFDDLENEVRSQLSSVFKRGNISVNLALERLGGSNQFQVNEDVLADVIEKMKLIHSQIPAATPPSLDGILAIKGVVETVESKLTDEDRSILMDAMEHDLGEAINGLLVMRHDEGNRMHKVISGHIKSIANLCHDAEKLVALHPKVIKERLVEQVKELLGQVPALSEERLAQEAAVLMTKADVREELDRLLAHIEAAEDLIAQGGPMGRRIDFLCQEFNREANTLCSKSFDVELTRIGLQLKATIEQLREQVQNIE